MRSNGLATIMLMIPVLTVPALAIFGIPQFTPVVASPLDDVAVSDIDSNSRGSERRSQIELFDDVENFGSEPDDSSASGLLLPKSRDRETPRRPPQQRSNPSRQPDSSAVPWDNDLSKESGSAGGADLDHRERRPEPLVRNRVRPKDASGTKQIERTTEPLTWKSAVEKLDEYEIRNFRIERGHQQGRYVFICSHSPHDSPSVSYRFEAEADEPLKAIEKVIEQIVERRQNR